MFIEQSKMALATDSVILLSDMRPTFFSTDIEYYSLQVTIDNVVIKSFSAHCKKEYRREFPKNFYYRRESNPGPLAFGTKCATKASLHITSSHHVRW